MLKHQRESRVVACLVCWRCHGRAGPNHYELRDGGAICGLCGDKNPLANLRKLPLGRVHAEYEIIVCFSPDAHRDGGMRFNVLSLSCATLTDVRTTDTEETFVRMLEYLGATAGQIGDYRQQREHGGQGSVHIRLLPYKRNLLRIDYSRL